MADGYTQLYDTEDIQEVTVDGVAATGVEFVAFAGLMGLLLAFVIFMVIYRRIRRK